MMEAKEAQIMEDEKKVRPSSRVIFGVDESILLFFA